MYIHIVICCICFRNKIYFNECLTVTIFNTTGHFNSDNSMLHITWQSAMHVCITTRLHTLNTYPLFIAKVVPVQPVLAENEKKKCRSTFHIKICSHNYSLTSISSEQKIQMKQPAGCWAETGAGSGRPRCDYQCSASLQSYFWLIAKVWINY